MADRYVSYQGKFARPLICVNGEFADYITAVSSGQPVTIEDIIAVQWNGQRFTLAEWGEKTGISPELVFKRLKFGWSPLEAFCTVNHEYSSAIGRQRASNGRVCSTYECEGVELTISEWAAMLGIKESALRQRIYRADGNIAEAINPKAAKRSPNLLKRADSLEQRVDKLERLVVELINKAYPDKYTKDIFARHGLDPDADMDAESLLDSVFETESEN